MPKNKKREATCLELVKKLIDNKEYHTKVGLLIFDPRKVLLPLRVVTINVFWTKNAFSPSVATIEGSTLRLEIMLLVTRQVLVSYIVPLHKSNENDWRTDCPDSLIITTRLMHPHVSLPLGKKITVAKITHVSDFKSDGVSVENSVLAV